MQKVKMVWTCNKKRWRRAGQRHGIKESMKNEDVEW